MSDTQKIIDHTCPLTVLLRAGRAFALMVLMSFVKGALLAILGRESLTFPNSLNENKPACRCRFSASGPAEGTLKHCAVRHP